MSIKNLTVFIFFLVFSLICWAPRVEAGNSNKSGDDKTNKTPRSVTWIYSEDPNGSAFGFLEREPLPCKNPPCERDFSAPTSETLNGKIKNLKYAELSSFIYRLLKQQGFEIMFDGWSSGLVIVQTVPTVTEKGMSYRQVTVATRICPESTDWSKPCGALIDATLVELEKGSIRSAVKYNFRDNWKYTTENAIYEFLLTN